MTVDMKTLSITGLSYIRHNTCGALRRKMSADSSGPRDACRVLQSQGILKTLPKNLGRFDEASLMAYSAVLWACVDAGIPFAEGKRRIGIVGSDSEGSLRSNQAFFADYVNAGRNSARSNLFVYTLPTTPLAEAALFCGFTGPVWYMYQSLGSAGRIVEEAAVCAAHEDIDAMLAVYAHHHEAVCFVVERKSQDVLFPAAFVQEHLKGKTSVHEILGALDVALQGGGVL